MELNDLRKWWEVPSIAHFCYVFKAAFNLFDFGIEELESALMTTTDEANTILEQLLLRLVKGCLPDCDVGDENWEYYLKDLLHQKKISQNGKDHTIPDGIIFYELPLRTKVEILHDLCDYRLQAEDVVEVLKGLEAEAMRVEPIGCDSEGNAYWYFYGTRLYMEKPAKKKHIQYKKRSTETKVEVKKKKKKENPPDEEESRWSLVCSTEEEWLKLAKTFKKSKSQIDKELHRVLTEEYIPILEKIIAEREKLLKKRELELLPKRSSARIGQKVAQRTEEERFRTLKEEEEKRKKAREEELKQLFESKEQKEREMKERQKRAEEREKLMEERALRAQNRQEGYEYFPIGYNKQDHSNQRHV